MEVPVDVARDPTCSEQAVGSARHKISLDDLHPLSYASSMVQTEVQGD